MDFMIVNDMSILENWQIPSVQLSKIVWKGLLLNQKCSPIKLGWWQAMCRRGHDLQRTFYYLTTLAQSDCTIWSKKSWFMYHKATMIFYVIFYSTLQLLLLNFNEGIAVGRGPVFNGPGRSLVSATLSDRQTYITANTCYMKYSVSCKRQRVMHDDKYHHCNAMQKPCII